MLELSNFNTSWKQNCRYLGHGWGFEVFPINCFCITDINHEWELNLWPGDLSSLPDVSRLRAECSWQLSCCRLLDNISPSPAHPGGSISLHRRVNQQTSWEICKKWEERRKSGQNMPVIALQRGGEKGRWYDSDVFRMEWEQYFCSQGIFWELCTLPALYVLYKQLQALETFLILKI